MTDENYYNHPSSTGTETPETREPETPSLSAFTDALLYRVLNGTFGEGPADFGSPISASNKLPNWALTVVQGTWLIEYAQNPGAPTGYELRAECTSGNIGDEFYIEQSVPISGEVSGALGTHVHLLVQQPSEGSADAKLALQYLGSNHVATGTATTATRDAAAGAAGTLVSAAAHVLSGGSGPTNAAFIRVRAGFELTSNDTFVDTIASVRIDLAQYRIAVAESVAPENYAAGFLSQATGLLALGGDGQTRAIAIPESTLPTPASGFGAIGPDATGRWQVKDDAGTTRQIDRTAAEIAADAAFTGAYQPLDSDLTAIAALSTTAYGRSLLAAADAAALRALAGTVIGTNVQAFDATLAALAGLATGANKIPYSTGTDTFAQADFLPTATAWPTPPALLFGGTNTGQTTSTITHEYFRFGPFIMARGRITLTAKGSSTGTATIANLPVANGSIVAGAKVGFLAGMVGLVGHVAGRVSAASTSITLHQTTATGTSVLTDAHFSNTSDVVFSIFYLA